MTAMDRLIKKLEKYINVINPYDKVNIWRRNELIFVRGVLIPESIQEAKDESKYCFTKDGFCTKEAKDGKPNG